MAPVSVRVPVPRLLTPRVTPVGLAMRSATVKAPPAALVVSKPTRVVVAPGAKVRPRMVAISPVANSAAPPTLKFAMTPLPRVVPAATRLAAVR